MALSQSALNELLEAIRAGDGVDTLREAMRLVLQELIEAEAFLADDGRAWYYGCGGHAGSI